MAEVDVFLKEEWPALGDSEALEKQLEQCTVSIICLLDNYFSLRIDLIQKLHRWSPFLKINSCCKTENLNIQRESIQGLLQCTFIAGARHWRDIQYIRFVAS